jgi:hypothetical protein
VFARPKKISTAKESRAVNRNAEASDSFLVANKFPSPLLTVVIAHLLHLLIIVVALVLVLLLLFDLVKQIDLINTSIG